MLGHSAGTTGCGLKVSHLIVRCYTWLMPTTRPRYVITETDEVARALDAAAERWPEDRDSRSKLVVHLLEEGCRAIGEAHGQAVADRREALRRTSGVLTGLYGSDYLHRIREDWAE